MKIELTLGEMLLLALAIAGVYALIQLASLLKQSTRTMKRINYILNDNQEEIKKTVNDITITISETNNALVSVNEILNENIPVVKKAANLASTSLDGIAKGLEKISKMFKRKKNKKL